jgi:hypothetical protein
VDAPAPRRSFLHLLIALSILLALVLGGILLFLFLISPSGSSPASIVSSKHIATAQTASGVDQQGVPTDANDTFAVGQTVYIAYLINDAGPGTVRITLYNNGHLIDTQDQQFTRRSTYNAYFVFPATQPGNWEADLYWQQPGTTGDGTLEQKVTFLVGSAALGRAYPLPITAEAQGYVKVRWRLKPRLWAFRHPHRGRAGETRLRGLRTNGRLNPVREGGLRGPQAPRRGF